MNYEKKEWPQSRFYGGFSDDRFMGVEHSFRYAKGVEIRKNPDSLTLAYATEAETIVLTAKVNSMTTIKSTGDIIAFCNDGKIWRKAAGTGSWALAYTDTGGAAILSGQEYNDYLYWATAGNIHRIAINKIDASWSGDVSEDYKAFANSNANAHPMLEWNNKLYIGDGFYLAELDSLGTWTNNKLEIFNDEEIRSLTFGGAVMRIFARKSTKLEGGHKYYWNGTSAAYNERVYTNQVIHCAIADGGNDYVIAGRRPFLYYSSGYEMQPLMRLPLVYDDENLYISTNAIDYYDNLLVFGLGESGDGSVGRGVWTFGREDYKYPFSLNFDYPTSNDNNTDKIFAVHNSNGVLYFSWTNSAGTAFGIDKINTAKFRTSGSLHSRVHYGDSPRHEKAAISVSLAFDKVLAGEKIEVYFRKNLATNWEAAAEISVDYAVVDDRNRYDKVDDTALDIGDYNFLETKIVLTAGTNQLTTPELVELAVGFEPEIETGD